MIRSKGVKWKVNIGALESSMKDMHVHRSSVSGTAYTVTRTSHSSWVTTLTADISFPLVTVPMLLKGAADDLTMHPIMLAMPHRMFPTYYMVLPKPLPNDSDPLMTTRQMVTPYIIGVK